MPAPAARPIYSVHVSSAKTWRGGENQIWLLSRGLQARGQKVLIVAPPDSPLLARGRAAHLPVQAVRVRNQFDVCGALQLGLLLRREGPDILHLHDAHTVLPGRMAAACGGRRPKLVAHRRTAFALPRKWKYNSGVDRIIAISNAVSAQIQAAGISPSLVRVVYSGLAFRERTGAPEEAVEALRSRLGLNKGAFIIGHAAALSAEKRQADLVAALFRLNQMLAARQQPMAHLVLAGRGPEEKSLKEQVLKLGAGANVHFAGFLQDTQPLWALSALAVFASQAEGLCTALIEAQAAGLPAVITRAGGMTEVVEAEQTGLVVEIGAADELAAALRKLYDDPALRARMGAAASARARQLFDAEVMVDRTLAVYRELVSAER